VHKVRQKLADTPHQERLRTSRASKVQSEIHAYALGSSATSASPRARLAMLSKRCDCAICPPCGGPADRSADCSIPRYTEVEAVPTPLSGAAEGELFRQRFGPFDQRPREPERASLLLSACAGSPAQRSSKSEPNPLGAPATASRRPFRSKRPTNLLSCSASSKDARIRLCDPIGDPASACDLEGRVQRATGDSDGHDRTLCSWSWWHSIARTLEAGHYRSCLTGKRDAAQARWL
jgi:hypothetical protein